MSSQFTKETNFCEQENITLKEWKQVKFLIWWSSGPRDNIAKQDQRFWLLDLGICNKLVWNIPDMGPVMFQNICNIYTYTHIYVCVCIYIYIYICMPFHRERKYMLQIFKHVAAMQVEDKDNTYSRVQALNENSLMGYDSILSYYLN